MHEFIDESFLASFQTESKKYDNINMRSSTDTSNLIDKVFAISFGCILSLQPQGNCCVALLSIQHQNHLYPILL
ncbi:hypothetical protein HKD37_10G028286 [Glycine soja]